LTFEIEVRTVSSACVEGTAMASNAIDTVKNVWIWQVAFADVVNELGISLP
jgi:hypothetical protein